MRSPWGLAGGGVMVDPSTINVSERAPERVLTTRQNQAFERLVAAVSSPTRSMAQAMSQVTIMVENPWTGEYHEAKMRVVADDRIGAAGRRKAVAF